MNQLVMGRTLDQEEWNEASKTMHMVLASNHKELYAICIPIRDI